MTAQDLVETLHRSGIELTVHGDRLRVNAPRGAMTPELRRELREHKAKLIAELAPAAWPAESLEAERRFGVPEARLYPFLNQRVGTPGGSGRLLQVFSERTAVLLDSCSDRVAYFLPSEIEPPGVSRSLPVCSARLH